MPIATQRLWLRRVYALIPSKFASLTLALQSWAFTALDSVKGGTIASTSANNHAVAFSNRDNGATPEDIASMASGMLDLYDASRRALIDAGTPTPTDAEILVEMLDRLQSVREVEMQFCNLRQGGW